MHVAERSEMCIIELIEFVGYILAVGLGVLGVVGTVVEATFEQLDGDHSEDELEEHVDDHDVEYVLQRIDHAVEHRLHRTTRAVVCLRAAPRVLFAAYQSTNQSESS